MCTLLTFAEFTERWCRDYGEGLAPKTYARYQSMLKRILPEIGHIRLDKLQPHQLMELYKDMGDDVNHRGLSFLPTGEFMDTFEEKGWTRDFLSKVTLPSSTCPDKTFFSNNTACSFTAFSICF